MVILAGNVPNDLGVAPSAAAIISAVFSWSLAVSPYANHLPSRDQEGGPNTDGERETIVRLPLETSSKLTE